MGAAGLVYDHFAQDSPVIIASKRIRAALKDRDNRDPTTVFGKYLDITAVFPLGVMSEVLKFVLGACFHAFD